jgi:hypothetical protein
MQNEAQRTDANSEGNVDGPPTSRRRFLKQLGVTVAAAFGAVSAMAATARAASGNCCRNCDECGNIFCAQNECHCLCDCGGSSYCWTGPGSCRAEGAGGVSCPC